MGFEANPTPELNKWYNYTITYNGGYNYNSFKFYFDGNILDYGSSHYDADSTFQMNCTNEPLFFGYEYR